MAFCIVSNATCGIVINVVRFQMMLLLENFIMFTGFANHVRLKYLKTIIESAMKFLMRVHLLHKSVRKQFRLLEKNLEMVVVDRKVKINNIAQSCQIVSLVGKSTYVAISTYSQS